MERFKDLDKKVSHLPTTTAPALDANALVGLIAGKGPVRDALWKLVADDVYALEADRTASAPFLNFVNQLIDARLAKLPIQKAASAPGLKP